jgi:endonuclease III related protein
MPPSACARCTMELLRAYGPQHWWPAKTAFEVILGAYLTQNTAWKAVERSLENLRSAGALTVADCADSAGKLRRLIRPSGFIMRKAPALKAFVAHSTRSLAARWKRWPPRRPLRCAKRLLELPGVGPETADAILLYALGHAVPVADEYLRRIAERHGLLIAAGRPPQEFRTMRSRISRGGPLRGDPVESRAQLFNEFHALTVAVGKAHCGRTARCEGCPLAGT